MKTTKSREEIDRLVSADADAAARALGELWRHESGPAAASFVLSRFAQVRNRLNFTPFRIAIARSFTVEPVVPLFQATAFTYGIDLTVHTGDFNAYTQEILDAGGPLYQFEPDAVILAVQTNDVAPDLMRDYTSLTAAEIHVSVRRVASQFQDLVRVFREHSHASLIVHSLELPHELSGGILDIQIDAGQTDAIEEINRRLRHIARDFPGVYLLDYDALIARHGRLHWRDERTWLTFRMPIAADHLIHLAQEWVRFLIPLTDKIAKVLVTDLDNTLWGGVIGEDKIDDIQVGVEYPGAAFRELQQAILDLHRRGIVLAICSKNNENDALEALSQHPGMLLRRQDFAAIRINWNDKTHSLREIAAQLNVGMETLAFLDDDPVERKRVSDELPQVTVINLPNDPMRYAGALRECPVFERLSITEEDKQRCEYYRTQPQRSELARTVSTCEDFYRSLKQRAQIAPVQLSTLSRVAQLTQKTNQFNLTTRRYSESEIADLMQTAGWRVLSLRVSDCYGDNGVVGVAITHDLNNVCQIDTLLMSCRVIGRSVETALLSHLVTSARARGIRRIEGRFRPTQKNILVRDFYRQHGFQLVREEKADSLWALDVTAGNVACPEWITITVNADDENE